MGHYLILRSNFCIFFKFIRRYIVHTITDKKEHKSIYPTDSVSGYCNATWDGFLCWPLTPPGRLASQLCPENVKGIIRGRKWTNYFFFFQSLLSNLESIPIPEFSPITKSSLVYVKIHHLVATQICPLLELWKMHNLKKIRKVFVKKQNLSRFDLRE